MSPKGRAVLFHGVIGFAVLASGCRRLRAEKAAPAAADPTPVPVTTEEARVPPAAAPHDPVSTAGAGAVAVTSRPSTSPVPTCENLSFIGGAMKTGGLASIGVAGFGREPGRFDVVSFGFADSTKNGFTVGGRGALFDPQPTGTKIDIRSVAGKKLEATVVAETAGASERASGTLIAKICPDR